MEKPKFLRVVQVGPGPMVNHGRSSVGMSLEDQDGNKYYTWFLTKNNYVDGVMKAFDRLFPVHFNVVPSPGSMVGIQENPPEEPEMMVRNSTGMKE